MRVSILAEQKVFWPTAINDQRPKLKVQINGVEIEGLVDTGADVTIISTKPWHIYWPLQEVNIKLLEIGTLYQVKHSARWVKCTKPERQDRKIKAIFC